MSRRRSSAPGAVAGALSLLGLLILVVGVPVALVLVAPIAHFHLPTTSFRHPSTILRALHHPLSDTSFVRASVLLAWTVWGYFLLCVLLEIAGHLRGRIPVRLLFGARLQTAVAAIIGASLSIMPAGRSAVAVRLQPLSVTTPYRLPNPLPLPNSGSGDRVTRLASSDSIVADAVTQPSSVVEATFPVIRAEEVAQAAATYTVRPGDTLWSIAERELGAPLRWKEIAELNMGLPQPGGTTLQDDHWILPGWVLALPSSSVMTPTSRSPHLTEIVAAAVDTPVVEASKPPAPHEHHTHVPVAPIGAGILGAGVVVMLDRMRRSQLRRRRTGRVIKLPEANLIEIERRLRVASNVDSLSSVDRALRLLGSTTRESVGASPLLVAVRVQPDRVELLFDPGCPPDSLPSPFEMAGDPSVWVLPGVQREGIGSDGGLRPLESRECPCPALVTIGYDGPTTLLVNLETLGSLSIAGADAALALEAVTVELGTLPWADAVDVIVVGHPGELRALERVRQVPTVAAAVAEARHRLALDDRLADDSGVRSTADARWQTNDSAWDALVVVCLPSAAEAEPEACRRLVGLAGDGRHGVVALIGTAMAARWTALAEGGPMSLTGPTGWAPHPRVVTQPSVPGLLADVDSIVSVASDDGDDPRIMLDDPAAPVPRPRSSTPCNSPAGARTLPEHEIEVRVLGPVEVVGAKPFTRAWALELVVYLVMHSGATTEQWSSALWPDRLMAPASLHSTASSARRSLGTSSSGEDHLPRSHGRLALAGTVTSDWARFRQLADSEDPGTLAEALGLIRGRPFLGLRATDWVLLEGFMADIEGLVVDTACRLAEYALQNRDPAAAEHAARQGLRVSEYDERLYRILLRAADAAGNPAGVESTMRELVSLVADEIEPYDAVHPETLELYKSLSRRGRLRPGA